jgi:hypothetical protein
MRRSSRQTAQPRPDGSSRSAPPPPPVFDWTIGIDFSTRENHSLKFGVVADM